MSAAFGLIIMISGVIAFFYKGRGMRTANDSTSRIVGFVAMVSTITLVLVAFGYQGILPSFSGSSTSVTVLQQKKPVAAAPSAQNDEFYAIVFDAGSTGSRVHAYKFKPGAPGQAPVLLDELFEQIKPGLSSFADEPEKGAATLVGLLDKTKAYIPKEKWEKTPLSLKATAGLRLLPEAKADALLAAVKKMLESYSFHLVPDGVQIMGGSDEGIFSWVTANFLKGTITDASKSVGLFDLGGGSTQITFSPLSQETLTSSPKEDILNFDIFNSKINLYTHSYLGFGLMSGRFQMMGGKEDPTSTDVTPTELYSACFKPGFTEQWKHGTKEYTVKPMANGTMGFDACFKQAQSVVSGKIIKPVEIQSRKIMAISYYQERAVDYGMIEGQLDGKELSVQDYFDMAQRECNSPAKSATPWLCMDLSYMAALLNEGFGLSKETKMEVMKKINGIEISWTLGAAFQLLNTK